MAFVLILKILGICQLPLATVCDERSGMTSMHSGFSFGINPNYDQVISYSLVQIVISNTSVLVIYLPRSGLQVHVWCQGDSSISGKLLS